MVHAKYKEKIRTLDQVLDTLKDGDHLVASIAAGEARELLGNLHKVYGKAKNIRVSTCLSTVAGYYTAEDRYSDTFFHDSMFHGQVARSAGGRKNVSFMPNHLSQIASVRLNNNPPNTFIGVGSMPDRHGFISMLSNVYDRDMIDRCETVIMEINPNFPRVFCDNPIHVSEVDYLIETDYPAPELKDSASSPIEEAIAGYVVDYIEDGSCLQLGIGGVPSAIAAKLVNKKDLGIHTELFTTSMVDLLESGAITGKVKNVDVGLHIASFIFGEQRLYDYVNDNPAVRLRQSRCTIDPCIMGKNDRQISINGALSVDLTGQISSESVGHRQFSGTGGQSDTARGAVRSHGGKSFIVLPSTALVKDKTTGESKKISRIVPQLSGGSTVSLHRNDVQYVATEYGVVNLRGMNIPERCTALISIAHPDFRKEITTKALECGIIF